MGRKKDILSDEDLQLADVGGIDLPDLGNLGVDFADLVEEDATEQTRYTKPKVCNMKAERVLYENAQKLARDLRLGFGERADVFVSGSFIFGDFIEAYVVGNRAKCRRMTISTLSLNQNNVDSLYNIMRAGYVDELNLIVSVYFWGNEMHSLIPYIYRRLDFGDKFQLAVASIHTKTAQFETLGGRKIVMHGSANLRSSGNIEQFTIEENPELYDFYDDQFNRILEKYATIRKPVRGKRLWEEMIRKKFND